MSFTHASYARAIEQALPHLHNRLQYLTRTGRFHPKLRDEVLAALESCQAHHEAAAKTAQRAEARMEDVEASAHQQLEASHGH
jgi:hypothetical protein